MVEKREDLFVGQFPGCLVFADKTVHERGDYKDLARVTHAGNIKYMVQMWEIPKWVKELVEEQSEKKKQEWMEYAEKEISYRPGHFYEKMLDELPLTEFLGWVNNKKPGMTLEQACRELLPTYQKYC